MGKYNRLCPAERKLLASWKAKGFSNKKCARLLQKHPSTIGRELKRNRYIGKFSSFYKPMHAQAEAERRKQKLFSAKHLLKNPKLYAYVLCRLRQGWSPEQITGRLKLQYPNDLSGIFITRPFIGSSTNPRIKTDPCGNICAENRRDAGENRAENPKESEFLTGFPFTRDQSQLRKSKSLAIVGR